MCNISFCKLSELYIKYSFDLKQLCAIVQIAFRLNEQMQSETDAAAVSVIFETATDHQTASDYSAICVRDVGYRVCVS